jgi:hypothetical protein
MFTALFQCRDCGSYHGYRSRPKTFAEKFFLPLVLRQTVRCGKCYRRSTQTIFVQVQERHESKSARGATASG